MELEGFQDRSTEEQPIHSRQMESELLRLILSRLEACKDIMRCSFVSKAWAEASKHAHYELLELEHRVRDGTETDFARAQLRWLQGLQKEGRLDKLQEAALFPTEPGDTVVPRTPSCLSEGLFVLAGIWDLRKVILQGPMCFTTAVAMLPTSITILELWPDTGPQITLLSAFKRFKKLQALKLALGRGKYVQLDQSDYEFVIDTDFPGLQYLAVFDRLQCKIAPGCKIDSCLLHLRQLLLTIKADNSGTQLAEAVITSVQLLQVQLHLLDSDGNNVDLVLPDASLIEHFVIVGPKSAPRVTLTLNKTGVRLYCSGVVTVSVAHANFNIFKSSYLTL